MTPELPAGPRPLAGRAEPWPASPPRLLAFTRIALFLYVVLLACPIRYWPLESGIDASWLFALNFAAAHGPAAASEVVFTMGPLTYLLCPQHVGDNLARGLLAQIGLWLALAAIFWDLFFRAGYALRNLTLFSCFFALAAPTFWFNFVGTENLILIGALVPIVVFHARGGLSRYVAALTLAGLLPWFKLTVALIGFAAIGGFLANRVIQNRGNWAREIALAVTIPAAVAAGVAFWVMPTFQSILYYLRGAVDLSGGYSVAMSWTGPRMEMLGALAALAVLAFVLRVQASSEPETARSFVWLLALPVFVSFKHGFVRQDVHTATFFCFIAVALALVSLTLKLDRKRTICVVPAVLLFVMVWWTPVSRGAKWDLAPLLSGERAGRMLVRAVRWEGLKKSLDASIDAFPAGARLDRELVDLVGDAPIASLSSNLANLAAARLQLALYPVVQRYAAYSPYLDGLNAAWIRDRGPRYLVYDGEAIDGRDPWAETPAMWLEVYRWYDTRFLGRRNLLLERRATPRFTALETISRARMRLSDDLRFPASGDTVFWTMSCSYSVMGRIRKVLYRIPPVYMRVLSMGQGIRTGRVILDVLASPVLGNLLPGGLPEFAAVFREDATPDAIVDGLRFRGSGSASYAPTCAVELLRPLR